MMTYLITLFHLQQNRTLQFWLTQCDDSAGTTSEITFSAFEISDDFTAKVILKSVGDRSAIDRRLSGDLSATDRRLLENICKVRKAAKISN